jgi:hypothetical protein
MGGRLGASPEPRYKEGCHWVLGRTRIRIERCNFLFKHLLPPLFQSLHSPRFPKHLLTLRLPELSGVAHANRGILVAGDFWWGEGFSHFALAHACDPYGFHYHSVLGSEREADLPRV